MLSLNRTSFEEIKDFIFVRKKIRKVLPINGTVNVKIEINIKSKIFIV